MLHTSRPLFSYNSRPLFFPPTTPNGSPCARISTWGYTGGNDLPWQGQRQPSQCLRQWNNQCQNQGADMILYFLKRLSFPFPFLPFFLSSLDICNTWFLAFEIGCGNRANKSGTDYPILSDSLIPAGFISISYDILQ